ncbi:MAG: carbohydrate-binding family 9-like protein [Oscillospiraceae bacterium]|nr:carbohydrate-binding family 9-like protein [Oscillospiraceae bacterium]
MSGAEPTWDDIEAAELVNVITGEAPRLATAVKMVVDADTDMWWILFEGEDDGVVADANQKHDDAIYNHDVFELFYSDTGDGNRYKELEVSPLNVTFDASIVYNKPFAFAGDASWELVGWTTQTAHDAAAFRSQWRIPLASLDNPPKRGARMPANIYRIDRGISSDKDEYTAWSRTGVLSFHVPERFGVLVFE